MLLRPEIKPTEKMKNIFLKRKRYRKIILLEALKKRLISQVSRTRYLNLPHVVLITKNIDIYRCAASLK